MSIIIGEVGSVIPHWTLLDAEGSVSAIKAITVSPENAGVPDLASMSIQWNTELVSGVVVSVTGANMSDGSGELTISSLPFDLQPVPVVVTPTADGGSVEVV